MQKDYSGEELTQKSYTVITGFTIDLLNNDQLRPKDAVKN
jgi:hypothetical protein